MLILIHVKHLEECPEIVLRVLTTIIMFSLFTQTLPQKVSSRQRHTSLRKAVDGTWSLEFYLFCKLFFLIHMYCFLTLKVIHAQCNLSKN